MKTFIVILALLCSSLVYAGDKIIRPTYPGSDTIDYSAPAYGIDKNGNIYRTIPGTTQRDYGAPTLRVDGKGNIYQTLPGSKHRDYSTPTYKVDKK